MPSLQFFSFLYHSHVLDTAAVNSRTAVWAADCPCRLCVVDPPGQRWLQRDRNRCFIHSPALVQTAHFKNPFSKQITNQLYDYNICVFYYILVESYGFGCWSLFQLRMSLPLTNLVKSWRRRQVSLSEFKSNLGHYLLRCLLSSKTKKRLVL